jgi:hypothetical protein
VRKVSTVVLAAGLIVPAACGDGGPPPGMVVDTSFMEDATMPGSVLRRGPASPEQLANPTPSPTVRGDSGQISIYDGFFVTAPCARPPVVDASLERDTIRVRIVSQAPAAPADTACAEASRAWGYATLVGQFDGGIYQVHVVHQGDLARAPLDTVYTDITIESRTR